MPIQVTDNTGSPKQGKKIDSATMPTGGKGVIGWLSAIWYKLTQGITVSGTVTATTGGLTDAELRATPVIVDVLNDSTATGTLTSSSDAVIISDTTGYATATIRVSGTWSVVGSGIYVYGESTNLVRLYVLNITGGNILSNIITNGLYVVNIAGCSYIKVRASDGIGGAGADITVRLSTLVHPLLYKQVEGVIDADLAATNVKPVLLGGIAFNSTPTSVSSDGDLSRLWTRRNGAVVIDTPNSDFSTSTKQDTQITSLQLIDDIVHSLNATLDKVAAIGAQLDDTSTTSATEDKIAPLRMTAKRALHTNLRKDDGTEIGTSSNPLYTNIGSGVTSTSSSHSLDFSSGTTVTLNVSSYSSVIVMFEGSFTTANKVRAKAIVGSVSTHISVSALDITTGTVFNLSFDSTEGLTYGGIWSIPCDGLDEVQLIATSGGSGTTTAYVKLLSKSISYYPVFPWCEQLGNSSITSPKGPAVASVPYMLTGFSTLSLQHGNLTGYALASAARTSDQSVDITNNFCRGIIVTLDVTATSATPSITLRIRAKDPLLGIYENLNAAPTAVTAIGRHTYILYPGADITEVGDSVQTTSVPLPRDFNIFVDHLDADSITYSVSYQLIL